MGKAAQYLRGRRKKGIVLVPSWDQLDFIADALDVLEAAINLNASQPCCPLCGTESNTHRDMPGGQVCPWKMIRATYRKVNREIPSKDYDA